MHGPDYPLLVDDPFGFAEIIRSGLWLHLAPVRSTPASGRPQEDIMVAMPRTESFQQATEIVNDKSAMPAPARRRGLIRKGALALALLAGTAVAGSYGHDYWTTGRFLESTDDAYVKADYTTIAPKVAGYIDAVLVQDNQRVTAGQVLARIDDRDFRSALAQANADVDAAAAAVRNLDAQIVLQQSLIEQARAAIDVSRAALTFADADAERYRDLMKTGSGTIQRAEQTESARGQAAAQLQRDQAGLVAAQNKVTVLATEREQARAQLDRSRALAHQAELNLSYTTITAPVDGTVGARSLRLGQFVSAGTQLMAVVPLNATYVVANFKETQLTFMRDGQPVELRVDSFPHLALKAHVDSVSPASGLEFALLPPDNATGNFTKIVQRIPVKITLDDSRMAGLLRAGMSVEPTVNTKAAVIGERIQPMEPSAANTVPVAQQPVRPATPAG
jgi:membrane fusion protein (multidrug efflux system)